MEDAPSAKAKNKKNPSKSEKTGSKSTVTPKAQTSGSKTLFVGNLSYSVERADVEAFFKDAGELVDGRFKGFGHVEFATDAAAQKTLEFDGQDLLGRAVRLDIALESKEIDSSYKKVAKSETIFIRGFDKSLDEDQIQSSLEEHFGDCGEITRVSIPKDYDTGASKGYEMLVEFFSCMDSSIRLLRLKGSMTTLKNISPKVEILTNRRFTYSHLAQLKHILPEAIGIKKILSHDETTLCMKPDLQVTLQLDAFDNGKYERDESGSLALRKMFRSRLLDFIKTHPEADCIPEETLPEPFNQTKLSILPKTTRTCSPSPAGSSSGALPRQPLASFSHLSGSFQRRFSQKTPIPESEKTQLELPNSPLNPVDAKTQYNSSDGEFSNSAVSSSIVTFNSKAFPSQRVNCSSNTKTCKNPSSGPKKFLSLPTPIQSFPLSPLICEEKNKGAKIPTEMAGIERTPVKLVSTPTRLITTTPELQTPKRWPASPSDDSTQPVTGAARNSTRARSLNFFSPVKTDNVAPNMDIDPCSIHESAKSELERSSPSTDKDIIKFLPVSLLQSVREKQKIATEEREMGLYGANRRQQVIACLPKLFNMIHLIFQSANRSVITKKELVHKIIANHCDIIDRREIEEQLKLLQELVPEWIYGKMASSGDFLICINKMSNTKSVRAKLAEAE